MSFDSTDSFDILRCLTVFSALRVFALWNRSYFCSLLILTLSLIPVATNIVCLEL
jgi:hypothetical protein